jgi:hypothetical protein
MGISNNPQAAEVAYCAAVLALLYNSSSLQTLDIPN